MRKKKWKKLQGTVQKLIEPFPPNESEKAQIDVQEADPLYREIRIANVVADEDGEKSKLNPGADVDVIIEADPDATTDKND